MNLVQLTGRHVRLKQELSSAYGTLPWNTGRIDRLTDELAETERAIAAARRAMADGAASQRSTNSSRSNRENSPSSRGARPDSEAFPPTIPCMVNPPSTHSWLGSFAGRLMQLRPSMKVGAAVQYAVMSIHHAADLDPCRAAELLVLASPTCEPVAAHRPTQPHERHASRYQDMFAARTSAQAGEPLSAAS